MYAIRRGKDVCYAEERSFSQGVRDGAARTLQDFTGDKDQLADVAQQFDAQPCIRPFPKPAGIPFSS